MKFQEERATYHLSELDGLRFFAIMIVLIWHASLRAVRFGGSTDSDFINWIPHGEMGVVLFFALSGFLLSRKIFIEKAKNLAYNYKNYFYRRFIRIIPVYYVVLFSSFVVLQIGYVPEKAPSFQNSNVGIYDSLVATMLMVHGIVFQSPPRLLPPGWSLEIEMQFYIIFPLIVTVMLWPASNSRRLLLIGCIYIFFFVLSIFIVEFMSGYRLFIVRYLHFFIIGILISYAKTHTSSSSILNTKVTRVVEIFLFMISTYFLYQASIIRPIHSESVTSTGYLPITIIREALYAVGSSGVLYITLKGNVIKYIFRLNIISWLGSISYSVYLVHIPVMQVIPKILINISVWSGFLSVFFICAVLICCSFLVGAFFFRLIEQPFAKMASNNTVS